MQDYDKTSVASIVSFAESLVGKSLSEVVDLPIEVDEARGKGKLGQLLEQYFFRISPPNNHDPDFPEAGLELKTTGVVKGSRQTFLAKERLVLTNINFNTIHSERWESSTLLAKCRLMLLMFYLFERDVPEIDRRFVLEPTLLDLLSLSPSDLTQIISDWEFIRDKVVSKKAHEISEGDTTYLKACRKGSGGSDERLARQANSEIRAQTRAFSFPASFISRHLKQGFPQALLNSDEARPRTIIEETLNQDEVATAKIQKPRKATQKSIAVLPSLAPEANETVAEATQRRISPFVGSTVESISETLGWTSKSKAFHSGLVKRMLTGTGSYPIELEKAQIQLRTITLDSRGIPTENFPLPAFDYLELVTQDWSESSFAEELETRYLLAVFAEETPGVRKFATAGYWTMPFPDRENSREVWEETRTRVRAGNFALPKSGEHPIAFVNTHGRDAKDLVPTPQGGLATRRSFWLNRYYIAEVIQSQLLESPR